MKVLTLTVLALLLTSSRMAAQSYCCKSAKANAEALQDQKKYDAAILEYEKAAKDCGCDFTSELKKAKNKLEKIKEAYGYTEMNATVPFEMRKVEGGTFVMGYSSYGNEATELNHIVNVRSYYIAMTEVTQAQWRAVMGSDPAQLKFEDCDECPVESITWNEAQEFLKQLNALTGKRYRLPTEAEWEFAARGGTLSQSYQYAGSNKLDSVAWSNKIAENKTHPVKTKGANELGLYDMSGNVWEWCQDYFDADYYTISPVDNPNNMVPSTMRVFRGGSFASYNDPCRVANRNAHIPEYRNMNLGFRLARDY